MKAVVFKSFGSSDVLELINMEVPSPKEDQFLVQVEATTIDNVDIIIRKGLYKTELADPAITGRDLVGRVKELGENVKSFSVGDLVWTNSAGYDGRMGATAEYVLVDADRLYPIPKSVDPFKLVASVHSSSTAQMVTREVMKLNERARVLIEGAGGNVGRKLVQCSHALGAYLVTSSSKKDFTFLKDLGADECFAYDEEGMDLLSARNKQTGFDHIIDTSGRVSLGENVSLLGLNGQVTMITSPPKNTSFDAMDFYTKGKKIQGFVFSRATCKDLAQNAKYLNEYFEKGLLLEDKIEYYSFGDVAKLQAKMEKEGSHGIKYVIRP
jgi:NADPH:quinone reductase-like Zn-dependent oxidoreductase